MWILYFVETALKLGKIIDDFLESMRRSRVFEGKVPSDKIQQFNNPIHHSQSNEFTDTLHILWKSFFDPEIPHGVSIIK